MKTVALWSGLLVAFAATAAAQQYSDLWGENGELWDPETGPLRDFTDVGYMNGDVAIPDWPVGVDVTNFGAIPDDDIDDSQAFIDAIAACPNNHAVFVPNGKYIITDQIKPERDYFVLRGEDMYETILYFPKNIKERYPSPDFDVISAFFVVEGGTHRSIESLTFEFREQTKMGHWEHRYPNAIRFGGGVEHSWARNLYIKNADNALTFSTAENISVLNIIFDHYIGRHFFINTAGLSRWVGHIGIGMGGANRCLFHNIEFKGHYFHDFDIINVPQFNVVSSVRGSEMSLNNHGQGARNNLYTDVFAGESSRIFAKLTDDQKVGPETFWNIDASSLIDPALFTDNTNGNVMVGIRADYASVDTPEFYYEAIDPDALSPGNIYLAQLAYRGKPLPEPPPPQPPLAPELTGDIRLLNPTDDTVSNFEGYMKFDLTGLQDLNTIAKARIQICVKNIKNGSVPFTMTVSEVADDAWSEDSVTSTSRPVVGALIDSTVINDEVSHKWWEFDITSFVQEQWNGDKTLSLYFDKNFGSFLGQTHGRKNGNAPLLTIERVADPVPGPPGTPAGVESTSQNGWIQLGWEDNTDADFSHYNVYADPAPNRDYPIAQNLTLSEFNNISDSANWPSRNPMSTTTVFRYSVTAVDNHGYESKRTDLYGVTLNTESSPPSFGAGPHSLPDAEAEAAFSASIAGDATDPDSDPLFFHKVSGPSWITISADGTLGGTPSLDDIGSQQVLVQVTSIGGTDQASYSLSVLDPEPELPTTTRYEAEDAVLSGPSVASNNAGYSGTGFADYQNASGDTIEWTVNVPKLSSVEMVFGYALGNTDRPLEIQVNGDVVANSLSFPGTGGWSSWAETAAISAILQSGNNTVRATAIGSSGGNVDYLDLTSGVDDGDGMDDAWELTHFGSAGLDNGENDGDGIQDFFEFLYDSDPHNPSSRGTPPKVVPDDPGPGMVFIWTVAADLWANVDYGVRVATDLTGPWDPLPTGEYTLTETTADGRTTVELRFNTPNALGSAVFVRLQSLAQ